jgi:glycosyl transferase, family 25
VIFDQFDTIRIINLPQRKDRRAEMLQELRRVGLEGDARVAFFPACSFEDAGTFYSKGARGCYHSHLAILEEAAAAGRSVLILEDDCDFTAAVRSYELPSGWAIFYGGYTAMAPDLQKSDIVGSHFMGFTAQMAQRLAPYLKQILESGHHPSIDGAYVWFRRAYPDIPTAFAVPQLGRQRPSRTDVGEPGLFDRLPFAQRLLPWARKLKRSARRLS